MLKKYTSGLWYNFKKEPINYLIAVLAVSFGLSAFVLLWNFCMFYYNFDKGEKDWQNWYRIRTIVQTSEGKFTQGSEFFYLFAPILKSNIPEIKDMLLDSDRYFVFSAVCDGKRFQLKNIHNVSKNFIKHYQLKFIYGNPQKALDDFHSLIISKSKSELMFGPVNPVGKNIYINGKLRYTVSGVFADIPQNYHLRSDIYAYDNCFEMPARDFEKIYFDLFAPVRFKIPDKSQVLVVESKINILLAQYSKSLGSETIKTVKLDPINRIHFISGLNSDKKTLNIMNIHTVLFIGIILLLAALLSFLNLHLLNWKRRTEEFSFRKAIGAEPKDLLIQLVAEYAFLFIFAELVALVLYQLSYAIFASVCGHDVYLYNILTPLKLFAFMLVPLIIALILILPQIFKTSFSPYLNAERRAKSKSWGNAIILFTQITITLTFIISALIISSQMHLIKTSNLGYTPDNLLEYDYTSVNFMQGIATPPTVINSIKTLPYVTGCTSSQLSIVSDVPEPKNIQERPLTYLKLNNKNIPVNSKYTWVYPDYFRQMGIRIIAGRECIADSKTEKMVNKAFVDKYLQNQNPLGKQLFFTNNDSLKTKVISTISGVIDNYQFFPQYSEVKPLIFGTTKNYTNYFQIRYVPGKRDTVKKELDSLFTIFSGSSFMGYDSKDVSSVLDSFYQEDSIYLMIIVFFALMLSVLVSFSLYSIMSLHIDRQKNDITLMKVWGAEPKHILRQYGRSYFFILLAGVVTGSIASWYLTTLFLNRFAQTIPYTFPYYLIGILIVVLMVFIPLILNIRRIYYQQSNDSLRSE